MRGRGLMWGVEMRREVAPIVQACQEHGLLVLSAGANVLRMVPPLTVEQADMDEAVNIFGEALGVTNH